MDANRNVWVIMSFGADAAWEGNVGYSDDALAQYQFDNFVPNSRRIRLGDALIIPDREAIFGFARVERLEAELGVKTFRRCPSCGTTKFKRRATTLPKYRCPNRHEFDAPTEDRVPCTRFTIHYGGSFTPSIPPTSVEVLQPAYLNAGTQLSIRPVEYERARSIAASINPRSARVFDWGASGE